MRLSLLSPLKARVVNERRLELQDRSAGKKVRLIYEDLKVWDANHRELKAHMELDKKGTELSLVVGDKDAVYPITIDPLNRAPEWTTSADGLLPALLTNVQLQVQTLYGYRLYSNAARWK